MSWCKTMLCGHFSKVDVSVVLLDWEVPVVVALLPPVATEDV